MADTIRADLHADGVLLLTLDRPPANAIDEALLADLAEACRAAEADAQVRAVVLTGDGAFFSAGLDLRAPRRDAAAGRRLRDLYRDAHLALLGLARPTVAMLRGHATAGGLVLVLACDYRLGAEGDYRVGLNEVAIGAAFPRVAMEIVRLRLPQARASELVLGAALYPATQATRLGIVDELLPVAGFAETVMRRAARLGGFPRDAYAHAKAGLVGGAIAAVRAETEDEAEAMSAVWTSAESRAARARQVGRLSSRG